MVIKLCLFALSFYWTDKYSTFFYTHIPLYAFPFALSPSKWRIYLQITTNNLYIQVNLSLTCIRILNNFLTDLINEQLSIEIKWNIKIWFITILTFGKKMFLTFLVFKVQIYQFKYPILKIRWMNITKSVALFFIICICYKNYYCIIYLNMFFKLMTTS